MGRQYGLVFSLMCRGSKPYRAVPDQRFQSGKFQWRRWGRNTVEFQITGYRNAWRAQTQQSLRITLGLRKADIKKGQKMFRDTAETLPTPETTLGHPCIDQQDRDFFSFCFQQEIWPKLRLGEQNQVRTPMLEKAVSIARQIERNKLVQSTRR